MGHAYTPGLTVTDYYVVRKERKLPIKGEVLVGEGDEVSTDAVVARTSLPGNVYPVNLAALMGVQPSELPDLLLRNVNERVEKGEALARSRGIFGLFKATAHSPVGGTLESVSSVTGQAIVRGEELAIEVRAYIDGTVVSVIPEEGVVVESRGGFIQGIFGVGGECSGEVLVLCESEDEPLRAPQITDRCVGKIVVGGSTTDAATLKRARELGVAAVVVGGLESADLEDYLGYKVGVAITGNEPGVTLILTEGFGSIPMSSKTFALFKKFDGMNASANGSTQIRAGVIRPEVIVGNLPARAEAAADVGETGVLRVGSPVRIIRHPFFGKMGVVEGLPPEPSLIETGAKTRILIVKLPDGESVTLPRANVELIES